MINASSSIASSFLSDYFGTSSSTASAGTAPTVGSDDSSSPDYLLDGSLGSDSFSADFLSNAVFAQDTEKLLNDPHLNGAIGGTASANVQKIIQQIEQSVGVGTTTPAAAATANGTTAATGTTGNTGTTGASGLPAGGVVG